MTQNELNQLVAEATGEDLSEIQRLGFSLVEPVEVVDDAEPVDELARFIDWDDVDRQRNVALIDQPPYRRAA